VSLGAGSGDVRPLDPPETRYTTVDGAFLGYQVTGTGPPVVLVADWFSHIDAMWTWPPYAHALRRLASFCRLIVFDKRGVGLSDPVIERLPALEEWQRDIRAVLDDLQIERASLIGVGAAGPMCVSFAAGQPERLDKLVLVNSYARLLRDDDYQAGYPTQLRDRILAMAYTDDDPARILRGGDDDVDFNRWWGWYQRQSVSPGTARRMRSMMFDVDVRSVLSYVQAPTLVVHRRDDEWVRVDHGRYLAEQIDGARLVELDGSEDLFFEGDADQLLDEVEVFIRGARLERESERVLATVMFSDLVNSTELAAQVGDARWRILLDDHDGIVARQVGSFGGRLVKYTGDGHLALFDGPGRAIRCSQSIRRELRTIGMHVRIGLHMGEIELRGSDVGGLGVVIGARIGDLGGPGEILASRTVRDLVVGSDTGFASRGVHQLKGVPNEWEVFEVVG
jgi:class 3 adenylate cyclase